MNTLNVKQLLLALLIATGLTACGSDVGDNEDKTNPSTALTSLNKGEEVIGTFNLTWATNDPNPSTVDIFLSSDSGASYPTIVEINAPDTGSFNWDSNTVEDCRNCRIKIIPHDVVGNEGAPVESAEDFIINNVPQVLGVAYYSDLDNNGFDAGDEIRVPFDKALEIRTSIASDIFFFPVLGDSIGPFSTVRKNSSNPNELIITMDDISTNANRRLHISGIFKPNKLGLTFPSGINLQDNISEGIIFSPDTGRTAAVAEVGIDILPAFSDSGQRVIAFGTISSAFFLADIDGDGDLDIIVANPGVAVGTNNVIWINGGDNSGSNTGIFTDSGRDFGSTFVQSIAMGDVDGDKDLDIVTASLLANRVWLNGGDNSGSNTGTFTDSDQRLGNDDTYSIALGDLDGDKDLDIVTGNNGANRVWLNGGDNSGSNTGDFTDSGESLGNRDTRSIALADLDGDKDLDIVAGNRPSIDGNDSSFVWINGGDNSGNNTGKFAGSGQSLGTNGTQSIAVGDIDGDKDKDIVMSGNFNDNASLVWLNGGDNSGSNTGIFTDSGQRLGNDNTSSIVLGDVDGDKDLDIVTGNNGTNRVWLNGGDSSGSNAGIFTNSDQGPGDGISFSIALADVDGDSDLDIITLDSASEYNESVGGIWLNSLKHSSTSFIVDSGQRLGNEKTLLITLTDIDGDKDLDIIENQDPNSVWINGGDDSGNNTGVFTKSGQDFSREFIISITQNDKNTNANVDIDGDGDLDIIVIRNNGINIQLNGGDDSGSNTGVFTDSGQNLMNADPNSILNSIALVDIDGDGDKDIISGVGVPSIRSDESTNSIWLNGGDSSGSNTGIFKDSSLKLGNNDTLSVALGDIDGDGDIDIITGNNGANHVWLNDF